MSMQGAIFKQKQTLLLYFFLARTRSFRYAHPHLLSANNSEQVKRQRRLLNVNTQHAVAASCAT